MTVRSLLGRLAIISSTVKYLQHGFPTPCVVQPAKQGPFFEESVNSAQG